MINSEFSQFKNITLHKVGNKLSNEGVRFSKSTIQPDEEIGRLLLKYFLTPFKQNEYYHFYHESDVNLNEVFTYASAIFNNQDNLYEQSINIAKHLYEQSSHPKIRSGELYVVYLTGCMIEGETIDAIGLFKSESRETYLKVYSSNDNFEIDKEDGININKLDKGCLIFNKEREKGYLVAVIDNQKNSDTQYWMDHFLHLINRVDEYHHTKNVLTLCKNFVTEKMPEEFTLSKAEQADLLNKSVNFFKENKSFDFNEFTNQIIQDKEVIKTFNTYKSEFETERDISIANEFNISESAVKKQAKVFKSVIKLDKNFHIYVHGNREYIVKGFDESTGLHYYQIYFKEEN